MGKAIKKIAILGGTGKEGTGLAMRWAYAGYQVLIGSRRTEKAEAAAAELNEKLGIESINGYQNSTAAQMADLCVLTVVQSAHEAALHALKDDLQGKILVDATARVEFTNPVPPEAPAAALKAQQILGEGVCVVAAFQNVPAGKLKRKLTQPIGIDVLVCGEDLEAVEQVIRLAEDAGMKAYYAGGLQNAVIVEGITALLIAMNKHYGGHSGSIQITGLNKQK